MVSPPSLFIEDLDSDRQNISFGLIWNDFLWAGTDTAYCYALAWCCRHFLLKQQPVSEEFNSFNQCRGSLLSFHSPKEGFLLFSLYINKSWTCQIPLLHCNYNMGMRNYSQSRRQRCGSINTFVKLTSSWQAGSTIAKTYLAGASMPATSGMQYVSLACTWLYVLFRCLWTILSCASTYLPWYFDDAMQSWTWQSSTSQTHSLFSFFSCSPTAKFVLFFSQVIGIQSYFKELSTWHKKDWVHAKRQSTNKRANRPTGQTQWRQRWGGKKALKSQDKK